MQRTIIINKGKLYLAHPIWIVYLSYFYYPQIVW